MFNAVSNKLTEALVVNGIIDNEDVELYNIGFQCGILVILNLFCVLITGVFLGIFAESAIFIFSFFILRICANGFHTKSIYSCFCISYVIEFAILLGIKYIPVNGSSAVIMAIIMAVISRFCPVPNENKQYNEKEISYCRKLFLVIFGVELAMVLIFALMILSSFCSAIIYGWALYTLLNVMGHLQNQWRLRHPTSI